jgi:hypothetical protein
MAVTATTIVTLYLQNVGTPTYGSSDTGGLIYFAPYPPQNPEVKHQNYLDEESVTRLVWEVIKESPSRVAVRDALATLRSIAMPLRFKPESKPEPNWLSVPDEGGGR